MTYDGKEIMYFIDKKIHHTVSRVQRIFAFSVKRGLSETETATKTTEEVATEPAQVKVLAEMVSPYESQWFDLR